MTATGPTSNARRTIRPTVGTGPRRLPVPRSEPPYDDEQNGARGGGRPDVAGRSSPVHRGGPGAPMVQGTLALSFALPGGYTAAPELRATLRLVGDPEVVVPPRADLSRRPPAGPLPDARQWAAKLTQAVVEALYGPRPVQQLARWTDDHVYRALVRRVNARTGPSATSSAVVPIVSPTVRSVRICRPTELVAEASAVIQAGSRSRAVALRLESRDQRWLCTALEVI